MAIAFPGAEGYGAGTQGARTGSGKITDTSSMFAPHNYAVGIIIQEIRNKF